LAKFGAGPPLFDCPIQQRFTPFSARRFKGFSEVSGALRQAEKMKPRDGPA